MKSNNSKSIFKKWWFWVLVVIIALGIIVSFSNGNKKQPSAFKSTNSKKESSKNKVDKNNYKNIQMGQSENDVRKSLGKPSFSSNTTIEGIKSGLLTWTNVSPDFKTSMVTVTVTDDKVTGKAYLKPILGKVKPIDNNKLNSIQNGSSYAETIKKLGDPATESYLDISGQKSVTAEYPTDKKGSAVSLTFINDSLTTKTETNFN